jgi:hypothetical protein
MTPTDSNTADAVVAEKGSVGWQTVNENQDSYQRRK